MRRRVIRRWLLGVGAVLLFAVAWVGVRGGLAAAAAAQGVAAVRNLEIRIIDQDAPGVRTEIDNIQASAAEAHALTSDGVWRTVEFVPFLGSNFTTVRESLAALDAVAAGALDAVAELETAVDLSSLMDSTRDVRLSKLALAAAPLETIDTAVSAASHRLAAVDVQFNIPPLAAGFGDVRAGVEQSADAVGGLRELSRLVPSLATPGTAAGWDIAITARDKQGVTRPVAYVIATTAGGRFGVGKIIDAASGYVPVSKSPGNLTVDVAALELLTQKFGPVRVPGVGDLAGDQVDDFVEKGAYAQAASTAEGERAIGAFAASVIDLILN